MVVLDGMGKCLYFRVRNGHSEMRNKQYINLIINNADLNVSNNIHLTLGT
jgi:hypothetical protein